MKKIALLFLVFFCGIFVLYSQNFSLNGMYSFQEDSLLSIMEINDSNVVFEYENPPVDKPAEVLNSKIEHLYGMPFIVLSDKLPMEIAVWNTFETQKNIQTDNKILFIMFEGKTKNIFAYTRGYSEEYRPFNFSRLYERGSLYKDCTSYLIEEKKYYPIENLRNLAADTPWVEGVKGDGIGEGFTIEGSCYENPLGPYLLIINGFISYEKPYLYKQNNRVKKIKVTGLNSGKTKILDILDTPHPQTVDISFIKDPEDIRIEIAAVYKGTKYDDTCIHYCINYDEAVIPYENSIGE